MASCTFVSESSGPHTRRWITALRDNGLVVHSIYRDDFAADSEFLGALRTSATSSDFVIVGPLDLANKTSGMSVPTVLLSWGFDLQEADSDLDLSHFSRVLVDSTANADIAAAAGATAVTYIPWGVDLDVIDRAQPPTGLVKYGVADHETVVLSLRAHEPLYRVSDIIEAFALESRESRLVIGNTGSLTAELKELSDRLAVNAVFLPAVDEAEVPGLLRRSSAYVTASRVDGTSVTLLQAMACEVPVVASENTGNLDWVEEGATGFLFPIADTHALNAALSRALQRGRSVIRSARIQVEQRANWQSNVQQLIPLLTSELGPPQ